jgi:hypothetical protein
MHAGGENRKAGHRRAGNSGHATAAVADRGWLEGASLGYHERRLEQQIAPITQPPARSDAMSIPRWLLVVVGTLVAAGAVRADSVYWNTPPLAYEPAAAAGPANPAPPLPMRADYTTLIEFQAQGDVFATRTDPMFSWTQFFFGDYSNGCVTMHTVDIGLARWETRLPLAYGVPWLCADLDRDGNDELVLQRGDSGMGGNGYLDIHSMPGWVIRAHIVLPGMKVVFNPVAIDVDGDGDLELYLTPSSLGGSGRVMLVDYDESSGQFQVTDDLTAPAGTYGVTAAADFDADGRVEFVTGNSAGYGLFEYDPNAEPAGLYYRGDISGSYPGRHATALRPLPDHALHVLLGHSSFANGYRYALMRATGDNTFTVVHVFQESTGYAGIQPSLACDTDLDGMDEIVMEFHPLSKVLDWDVASEAFQQVWAWDETTGLGTFIQWATTDIDWDGVPECASVNHMNVVHAFEDADASTAAVDGAPPVAASRLCASPNPASGPVSITWSAGAETDAPRRIDLIDVQGRLVRSWTLAGSASGASGLAWDGRDAQGRSVPAGIYALRAHGETGYPALRLIRAR